MPLDPNIILQAGNFKTPDYATTLAQVANIKASGQEAKLRDLQISGVQRDQDQRVLLSKAFDPATGEVDPVKAKAAFMASGDVAGARKFETDRLAAVNAQIDNAMKIHGTVSQILGGVTDQASLDAARAELGKNPALAQGVAQLPAQYDEAGAATIQNLVRQGQSIGEQLQAKKNETDAARQKAKDDQDKLEASPDFKAKVAGAVAQAELPAKLAEQKARAEAANQPYDAETIDFLAEQGMAGDKSVLSQMGFGPTGASNRKMLRDAMAKKAKERGLGGADLAALNAEFAGLQAGERTLGNRTANIEMAVTEAQQMAPLALTASAKVNRSQYPTLNAVILAAEKGTGGEDVVRLGVATNSLINIYARAISPTGVPTVSDKDHAREILSSAWSNGQYKAGVDQMMLELAAARKSPGTVRGAFRSAISGNKQGDASVPDAPSETKTLNGLTYHKVNGQWMQ